MSGDWDLAIVGGGAAGLAAGIFAAEASRGQAHIVILEGSRRCGTKILASGGGRCNVTHEKVTPDDFNGSRNIVRNVLAAFGVEKTVEWFRSMGVELKREETGKLFPVTDSARTVLNALLERCRALDVHVQTNCRITGIRHGYELISPGESARARRVILATGGRSLPKSGSDGSGWDLARQLGHTVTKTYPALTPLVLAEGFLHAALSGISLDVELSTFAEGKLIDRRTGAMLFTHFGISGPAVMDASRHWVIASEEGRSPEMRCNLLPGMDFALAEKWLIASCGKRPKAGLATLLSQRLPERLAEHLLLHAGIEPRLPAGQLSREARRKLMHVLTALPLPVTGSRGWNYAEVTAGGVPLAEIDYRTMQSRKSPGLYLVGEILDCDGRIGGFNFQWAWATGYVGGRAAGEGL